MLYVGIQVTFNNNKERESKKTPRQFGTGEITKETAAHLLYLVSYIIIIKCVSCILYKLYCTTQTRSPTLFFV